MQATIHRAQALIEGVFPARIAQAAQALTIGPDRLPRLDRHIPFGDLRRELIIDVRRLRQLIEQRPQARYQLTRQRARLRQRGTFLTVSLRRDEREPRKQPVTPIRRDNRARQRRRGRHAQDGQRGILDDGQPGLGVLIAAFRAIVKLQQLKRRISRHSHCMR